MKPRRFTFARWLRALAAQAWHCAWFLHTDETRIVIQACPGPDCVKTIELRVFGCSDCELEFDALFTHE